MDMVGYNPLPASCVLNLVKYQTDAINIRPIIDRLRTFPEVDEVEKNQAIIDMKFACQDIGFFIVEDHGVGEEIISDTLEQLKNIMGLKIEEKLKQKSKNFQRRSIRILQSSSNKTFL